MPRSSRPQPGFTLIELLLVVSVLSLLIAILLPSLSRSKEFARRSVCENNLRQVYQASVDYALGQRRRFPPRPQAWSHYHLGNFDPPSGKDSYVMGFKLLTDAKLIDPAILFCPCEVNWNVRQHFPDLAFGATWKPYLSSYAQREELVGVDRFTMSTQPTLAYTADWFTTAIPAYPYATHSEGWNVGYFDGSVSWMARTPTVWTAITWSHDFTGQSTTWRAFDR